MKKPETITRVMLDHDAMMQHPSASVIISEWTDIRALNTVYRQINRYHGKSTDRFIWRLVPTAGLGPSEHAHLFVMAPDSILLILTMQASSLSCLYKHTIYTLDPKIDRHYRAKGNFPTSSGWCSVVCHYYIQCICLAIQAMLSSHCQPQPSTWKTWLCHICTCTGL
jgi:hypothetical protein